MNTVKRIFVAALEQVYAPKSLEMIERYAFDGCTIPAFEIPENVRSVQEYVFEHGTQLYIPAYRHHPENFDWYDSCFAHTGENIHWGTCME